MKKDYYVTLTGSKNNAGDFLIKYRAFQLFKAIRPDREIIDFNEWEKISDEKLYVINNAKALILLGGPGVVPNMYPNIYPLRDNLDDITVPIIMMGLGWKDIQGNWEDTYCVSFTEATKRLLKKIDYSGYLSSVRGYHTLNTLHANGYKNVLMTGCPAYYDLNSLNKKTLSSLQISKVAFSLGVSFLKSAQMEMQMKSLIATLAEQYKDVSFEVVFHHALINIESAKQVYGDSYERHVEGHLLFAKWLEENNIKYVDISGSAENLMKYYTNVDLHIGYRVHAHIFMNSISKVSFLLSEDGRAKEIPLVIGDIVINGYDYYKTDLLSKIFARVIKKYDRYHANKYAETELINSIIYEKQTDYHKVQVSRRMIDENFKIMKKFMEQLP